MESYVATDFTGVVMGPCNAETNVVCRIRTEPEGTLMWGVETNLEVQLQPFRNVTMPIADLDCEPRECVGSGRRLSGEYNCLFVAETQTITYTGHISVEVKIQGHSHTHAKKTGLHYAKVTHIAQSGEEMRGSHQEIGGAIWKHDFEAVGARSPCSAGYEGPWTGSHGSAVLFHTTDWCECIP